MYKYSIEYFHKMDILEGGSCLRPRIMKCTKCKLYVEIHDGHIFYFRDGKYLGRGWSCMLSYPCLDDWDGAKQW